MQVDDLQADTDYTWYAFFLLDGQRTTSEFQHFTTPEDPALKFLDISAEADIYSVLLQARLSRTQGVLSCGFALAEESGDFTRNSVAAQSDGFFRLELDHLEAETSYRFYVWAQTEDGEVVSDTFRFTTKQAPHEEISFERIDAQAGATSALLRATLSQTEGITECGFGLSANRHDYIEYSASLSGDGFEKTVSGLTQNTTYYYYAYFILDGKTYQSTPSSFTTSHE